MVELETLSSSAVYSLQGSKLYSEQNSTVKLFDEPNFTGSHSLCPTLRRTKFSEQTSVSQTLQGTKTHFVGIPAASLSRRAALRESPPGFENMLFIIVFWFH